MAGAGCEVQTLAMVFNIGDTVLWVRACSIDQQRPMVGRVLTVIASESALEEFTMYDVKFEFGTFTLYGTQLTAAPKSDAGRA